MGRVVMAGILVALATFLSAPTIPTAKAAQPAAPVELSNALLDYWVALMQQIGTRAAADSDTPPSQQIDQRFLNEACKKAGFASLAQCSCTTLYAAVLMNGYDRDSRRFIDPSIATAHRIGEGTRRDKASAAGKQVQRDERIVAALDEAFPDGVPAAHVELMNAYFRDRMPRNAAAWRDLSNGITAFDAKVLANQCPLPGLTSKASKR